MSEQPQPGCSSWYQDSPVQSNKSKESNIFIIKPKNSSQPAILPLSKCTTVYEDYGSISSMSLVSLEEHSHLPKVQVESKPSTPVESILNEPGSPPRVLSARHHARSSTAGQPRKKLTRRERIRLKKEAEDEEWIPEPVPRYLHTYLDFIYYSCLIPYKRENPLENHQGQQQTQWWKIFHWLQKAIFWILALFAISQSGIYAKHNLMRFLDDRKPDTFVDFGYHAANLLVRLFWIFVWTYWPERVGIALESIETYEEHIIETAASKNGGSQPVVKTTVIWVIMFGLFSWVAAFGKTIFSKGLWKFSDEILDKSTILWMAVLDWKVQPSVNGTESWRYYADNYGTEMNAATATMGTIGVLADLAGRIQLLSIRDTFFILAFTLGRNLSIFARSIRRYANMPLVNVRPEDAKKMGTHWKTYRKAKDFVLDINWAFGTLLKLSHVCNELLFAYFMSYCLEKDSSNAALIWMLFTIAKVIYAYTDAAMTHRFNTLCEKWIENWSQGTGKVQIEQREIKVKTLLKEIKREPFALGEGNFVIDEVFVFKFFCFAVSLVLFLVNSAKE